MINNLINEENVIDTTYFNDIPTEGEYIVSFKTEDNKQYLIDTYGVDDNGKGVTDSYLLNKSRGTYKLIMEEVEDTILTIIKLNNPYLYEKISNYDFEIYTKKVRRRIDTAFAALGLCSGVGIGYFVTQALTTHKTKYIVLFVIASYVAIQGFKSVTQRDQLKYEISQLLEERNNILIDETSKFVRIKK